jgi:hypothetical protein
LSYYKDELYLLKLFQEWEWWGKEGEWWRR